MGFILISHRVNIRPASHRGYPDATEQVHVMFMVDMVSLRQGFFFLGVQYNSTNALYSHLYQYCYYQSTSRSMENLIQINDLSHVEEKQFCVVCGLHSISK